MINLRTVWLVNKEEIFKKANKKPSLKKWSKKEEFESLQTVGIVWFLHKRNAS